MLTSPRPSAAAAPGDPDEVAARLDAARTGSRNGGPLDLRGARLVRADLAGLDLTGADLEGADLSCASLAGARLFGARLRGATLFEADLSGAELSGADLREAGLTGAKLVRAGLGMARLDGARLERADLSGATLTGARLVDAELSGAVLEDARLLDADLTGAHLTGARLRGSELSGAAVAGARLERCDLRGARLAGVTGYERASWLQADLREVDFTGAHLLRRFALHQNFVEEFRRRSRGSEVAYQVWRLTSDCGRSALRWTLATGALMLLFAWLYTTVGVDYGPHPTPLSPLYFSVVTMTTLGYGDVMPATLGGQVLAMAQVVVGYVMLGGLLTIFSNKMVSKAD